MELSPVVATIVPLIGIAVATMLGMRAADAERASYWGTAFLTSIALGVGLTFAQVLLHGLCIDGLHLCQSRGDGNMTYWFQSFFAIPIFWLASGGTWQLKK
jgi:hypothetical protein